MVSFFGTIVVRDGLNARQSVPDWDALLVARRGNARRIAFWENAFCSNWRAFAGIEVDLIFRLRWMSQLHAMRAMAGSQRAAGRGGWEPGARLAGAFLIP
jgi:hypothetical protein